MGLKRDSVHKRRKTGGKQKPWRKSRKFELARPPALTKISPKRVHLVRVRGGSVKFRALRLDTGNFSWGTEATARKCRILSVTYNASDNEFIRTNTLVKNSIVQIDATPFRQWYEHHYGVLLSKKKKTETEVKKAGKNAEKRFKKLASTRTLDSHLEDQFATGRLYACVSSRPGQCGRCDGYVLEGKELDFYLKKMAKKKEKKESGKA